MIGKWFKRKNAEPEVTGRCSYCQGDILGQATTVQAKCSDGILNMKLCEECAVVWNQMYGMVNGTSKKDD